MFLSHGATCLVPLVLGLIPKTALSDVLIKEKIHIQDQVSF